MPDLADAARADERPAGLGAAWFTLGGLAAAFGLASCCALPLAFATLGLSAAWLGGIAIIAAPYRDALLVVGAGGLVGGAVLLWRQQRRAMACGPQGVCSPPAVRRLTIFGLLIGTGLFLAGLAYA